MLLRCQALVYIDSHSSKFGDHRPAGQTCVMGAVNKQMVYQVKYTTTQIRGSKHYIPVEPNPESLVTVNTKRVQIESDVRCQVLKGPVQE